MMRRRMCRMRRSRRHVLGGGPSRGGEVDLDCGVWRLRLLLLRLLLLLLRWLVVRLRRRRQNLRLLL